MKRTLFWVGCFIGLVGAAAESGAMMTGGMEGGGGKSVVCRNADGSIRTTEILDLYEGRTVYQLPYQESSVIWTSQAVNIFNASGVSTDVVVPTSTIFGWYKNAINHLTFLPAGTKLKPIDDSLEAVIPEGCNLEQTVNYVNDQLILVDGEIWQALSETQKAALLIHESTYRYLRSHGETDSRRARHFNAFIVSGGHVTDVFPGNNYQLLCEGQTSAGPTVFYAFKLPPDSSGIQRARLQFALLGGRQILSQSYVDLDIGVLANLENPTNWIRYQSLSTQSVFESGDTIDLWIHPDNSGKWLIQILGISTVDGSTIAPVDLSCMKFN